MITNQSGMDNRSTEEDFLTRMASGKLVTQDEYDQTAEFLPPEVMAEALARRFEVTGENRLLVEAAYLFLQNRAHYQALEVCSRAPNAPGIKKIIAQILSTIRSEYPDTGMVGKLTEEALLVIDLTAGTIIRFPPILPTTEINETG